MLLAPPSLGELPVVPAHMRWGFAVDEFDLSETVLESGDVLGELLMARGLTYPQVNSLVEQCKGKFNISSMRIGRSLHFLAKQMILA